MTNSFIKGEKAVTDRQPSLTDEMINGKKIHSTNIFIEAAFRVVLLPSSSETNDNVAYINGKYVDQDGNNRTCGPGLTVVLQYD